MNDYNTGENQIQDKKTMSGKPQNISAYEMEAIESLKNDNVNNAKKSNEDENNIIVAEYFW